MSLIMRPVTPITLCTEKYRSGHGKMEILQRQRNGGIKRHGSTDREVEGEERRGEERGETGIATPVRDVQHA